MSASDRLRTSASVERLLAVEDAAPTVLSAVAPGGTLPLWPRVRMFFASALAADELGSTGVATSYSRLQTYRRLARAWLPSRHDPGSLCGRADVVMIASGVTTSVRDGLERNWLVGDYAEHLGERSALLQWTRARPGVRPAFARTRSLDSVNARTDVRAFRARLSEEHSRGIGELVSAYARLFDGAISPEKTASITASARYQERRAPLLRAELMRILTRLAPHTVLLEDASYGHRGDLVAAMKAAGIHVAEPQHGWIGPSHAAYNVGAVMRQPALRSQLPDELLTFGDFWSEGIRIPGVTTTLGKPHLERSVRDALPVSERPRTALIASSISEPEATARFVLDLRDRLPDWTFRFRPHPTERATLAERYPLLVNAPGVQMDPHDDLYVSLRESRAVIGVASTVLFEAADFDCDVIVRRSPFTDFYVGDLFGPAYDDTDVAAVAARLASEDAHSGPRGLWAADAGARVAEWARNQRR